MKRNRIGALAACLALVCSLLTIPAAAKTEPGVYTASMVTSYYNPDTGNVDDGGTANAALGEGMCRSATDKTALVEVDGDGNIWVTVRLLLQSNCSNVAFYTRSGYDSYSQVSYDIIAEDAANDSIDYRFPVTEAGQKLKCTMYVSPMGRDVLWYLYVDTGTLKSGSGDFEVSIDLSAAEETPVETSAPVEAQKPAESTAPASNVPAQPEESTSVSVPVETQEVPEAPDQSQQPEEQADSSESGEAADPADADRQEETDVPDGSDSSAQPEEEADGDTSAPQEDGTEPSGGSGGGTAAAIAAVVVVVLAGAAVYFIRRKK